MLNYVAIKVAVFLRLVLWKNPAAKGFPQIKAIPEAAHLPKLFGIHIGWIIALVITVFVAVYLKYTKRGYETRVVGESERTAHYAGINVRRVLIGGVALSGAIVGLAGLPSSAGYRMYCRKASAAVMAFLLSSWHGWPSSMRRSWS